MGTRDDIRSARRRQQPLLDALEAQAEVLDRIVACCIESLRGGGKLLFFGNGGSASQAQHFAAELVNRYAADRRALPALALGCDGAVLTSVGNDSSFERIFARQIEALGAGGDVALALSTGGESVNVIEGLRAAQRLGLRTAAFLGREGGPARHEAELALIVPGAETARIQEIHLLAGHLLCERIEQAFIAGSGSEPASGRRREPGAQS